MPNNNKRVLSANKVRIARNIILGVLTTPAFPLFICDSESTLWLIASKVIGVGLLLLANHLHSGWSTDVDYSNEYVPNISRK